mgnify:CR=1 FL=1
MAPIMCITGIGGPTSSFTKGGLTLVTYSWSGDFVNGNAPSSTIATDYVNWLTNLESATSDNITELTATFSAGGPTTYTITDSTYIAGLKTALTNGNTYGSGSTTSWALGWNCQQAGYSGSTFIRGGNHSPTFIFDGTAICTGDHKQIRPLIGNSNWGGWAGGANQPSQTMGMSFTVSE